MHTAGHILVKRRNLNDTGWEEVLVAPGDFNKLLIERAEKVVRQPSLTAFSPMTATPPAKVTSTPVAASPVKKVT